MKTKENILKITIIAAIFLITLTGHTYATIEQLENSIENKEEITNTYFGVLECNLWNIHVGQDKNGYYMNGNIDVCEWVNNKVRPLTQKPKIELISTDGEIVKEFKVELRKQYDWGSEYYFYLDIDGIDIWKEYKVKITNLDVNNTNTSNNKEAIIPNWIIGNYWEFKVGTKNSVIYFNNPTYFGVTDCNLWNVVAEKNNNGYYIHGNIDICEWIDNKTRPLTQKPKIQLISTDGIIVKNCYIEYKKGYNWGTEYYFDAYIDGIDVWKEYQIVITNTDSKNINSNKSKIANINKSRIGYYWEYNLDVKETNIIYFKLDYYYGELDCNLWNIVAEEGKYGYYIHGNIDVCEWVDNKTRPILFNPQIELVSIDGEIIKKCYVEYKKGYVWGSEYYFDVYIDGIDIWKEYKTIIRNTDLRNTNMIKEKEAYIRNQKLGKYWEYTLKVLDSKIIFKRSYITEGIYGVSGLKSIGDWRGSDLKYYKLGWGPNVFFGTFAVHGFEDLWNNDGKELTIIAEEFADKLENLGDESIFNKWTIYIFPQVNPDGTNYGFTNNGPGRHTLYGTNSNDGNKGIDLNRCWPTESSYIKYTGRNYNGKYACSSVEATYLRSFLISHKSEYGQTVLVDLHGWLTETIGDEQIGSYYRNEYGMDKQIYTYGKQYLINWAQTALKSSNGTWARTALIELPEYDANGNRVSSHEDIVNEGYSDKYYNATIKLLRELI